MAVVKAAGATAAAWVARAAKGEAAWAPPQAGTAASTAAGTAEEKAAAWEVAKVAETEEGPGAARVGARVGVGAVGVRAAAKAVVARAAAIW